MTGYTWTIEVIAGKDLTPSDVTELADPYVVLYWSTGEEEKTETHRFSLNPNFGESFSSPEGENQRYAILEVWDKDTMTPDDFMGTVRIDLRNSDPDKRDEWFDLKDRSGDDAGGALHIAVTKHPVTVQR